MKLLQNKNFYIYLVSTLMLFSLAVPTLIWYNNFFTSFKDKIDSQNLAEYGTFLSFIVSFWGLVFNFILVIIAYNAFKNLGIKEQYHQKQLSVVTELVTEMSNTVLSNMLYETKIDPYGNDRIICTGFTLSFYEISLGFDYKKFDIIYVKSNNIENCFPFLRFRRNPLLPINIAKQLEKLYRPLQYTFAFDEKKFPKNYVFLYSNLIQKEDFSRDWVYVFYEEPSKFSEDCKQLRKSITNWLKDYGAEDINI